MNRFLQKWRFLGMIGLGLVAGCQVPGPDAGLARVPSAPVAANVHVSSLVCQGYKTGGELTGWVNTGKIIAQSVKEWYSQVATDELIDPSRIQLKTRLARSLDRPQADLVLIYLGIRQDKQGRGMLVQGEKINWDGLFPRHVPSAEEARRTFFILDGCHAGATLKNNPRLRKFGTWVVACAAGELVLERDLKKRRGYDFRRRHPLVWSTVRKWLSSPYLVSHTGLVWLCALERLRPPASAAPEDLGMFLHSLTHMGETIARESKLRNCTVPTDCP